MFQVVIHLPFMSTSLSFVRNDQCPYPKHMFVIIVFVYISSLFRVFCHQSILMSIWWVRRRERESREEEKEKQERKRRRSKRGREGEAREEEKEKEKEK